MKCNQIHELLPWYLRGTLDEAQAAEIRDHLTTCEACRRELEETAFALAVHAAHATPEELFALAGGEASPEGSAHAAAERHVAHCPDCAEELEIARASLQALEASERAGAEEAAADAVVRPFRAPAPAGGVSPAWRFAALAAGLVSLAVSAAWMWNASGLRRLDAERAGQLGAERTQLAALEERNQELERTRSELSAELGASRERLASLEERIGALGAPRLNVPVLDVYPADIVYRGSPDEGAGQANLVPVPAGAPEVTLILGSQLAGGGELTLAVVGSQGEVLWRGERLARHPQGDFTVTLPVSILPQGALRLDVRQAGTGRTVETYLLEIRRE